MQASQSTEERPLAQSKGQGVYVWISLPIMTQPACRTHVRQAPMSKNETGEQKSIRKQGNLIDIATRKEKRGNYYVMCPVLRVPEQASEGLYKTNCLSEWAMQSPGFLTSIVALFSL